MALYPDYCTAAELKSWMAKTTTTGDTGVLDVAITAASRAIDHYCDRQFGTHTSASTKYFTAEDAYDVKVFDIATTTQLSVLADLDGDNVYETTLTLNTDFILTPRNANGEGRPWTRPKAINDGYFPTGVDAIEVSARWGWSSVPAVVKLACLIQAARFATRPAAPFGVAGVEAPIRILSQLDPDVQELLGTVRRHWAAV